MVNIGSLKTFRMDIWFQNGFSLDRVLRGFPQTQELEVSLTSISENLNFEENEMSSGSNLLTYSLLVNQYREYCFFRSDDLGSVPLQSVHWGINPPLFLAKPPLKSTNCPSPPFQASSPPLYLFFVPPSVFVFREPPLLKVRFFSEPPKY